MGRSIDFGIDLGTTNSAIARQVGLQTEVIGGTSGPLLPSVVHVAEDGTIAVGREAVVRRRSDPANVAAEFKRLMGTSEQALFGGGRTMSPERLSAEVLKALLARAEAGSGARIEAAVITIPAMFQLPQCEATRNAARLAGLAHAPLLQEPIAAAIASIGSAELRDGYWLVYDLGGGTFDVSLLRSRGGRLQVLDHDGDNHLGGKDFDRVLARWMAERVRDDGRLGAFARGDPAHSQTHARLRLEAERVRILLSDRGSAPFSVKPPDEDAFELMATREALEALLRPAIARTVRLCRDILGRNRLEPAALGRLVLVGGPTFTPFLRHVLADELGIEVRHHVDPTLAVVTGAAIYAATQQLPAGIRPAHRPDILSAEIAYEAMTNNPRPVIAGKLVGARAPGRWRAGALAEGESAAQAMADVGADGGFLLQIALAPGRLNAFTLVAEHDGIPVPLAHAQFVIVHGTTVAKPLLSQSVGVMLADNSVRWYLRKGAVLPTRQTVSHSTTRALKRGESDLAVHVPLIQGESQHGDRNTVIGEIRITAKDLVRDLASGAEVVVTLSVDEHSATTARAYVPLLDQTFDEIVRFELEARSAEAIRTGLAGQEKRLAELARMAEELDGSGEHEVDANVRLIGELLEEDGADARLQAGDLLQRMTGMIDSMVSRDAEAELVRQFANAEAGSRAMLRAGDAQQGEELNALAAEFRAAIGRADLELAEARMKAAQDLEWALYQREPRYWYDLFDYLCRELQDGPKADEARLPIADGTAARARDDLGALVDACLLLIPLLPERSVVSAAILSHVA